MKTPSESTQDARTVFVRGLDASVTDELLSSTFSSIGPVKHAFLVKKRASGGINLNHHKGFGFVQFALEEDAVRAVQEMHGTRLEGRVIKVEGAKKRASFEVRKEKVKAERAEQEAGRDENRAQGNEIEDRIIEKKSKVIKKAGKTKEQQEKSQLKHNLVRTVAVGGLGADDVEGAIKLASELKVVTAKKVPKGKKGSKEEQVTSVLEVERTVYPVPPEIRRQYRLEQDGCSGEVVLIQYTSVKDALAAVRLLHGQQKQLSQAPGTKKSGKGKKNVAVLWARQVSGDGLYLKKHRVVVRNLPFDVTEEDLQAAFGEFMLWEVTLPRGAEGQARGFAFIGFVCRQDAERAIAKVNGVEIRGRTVAVDWAVSKRDFEDEKKKGVEKPGEPKQQRTEGTEDVSNGGIRPGQEVEGGIEEDIDFHAEKSRVNNVLDSILGGGGGDDDYFEEIEDDSGDEKSDERADEGDGPDDESGSDSDSDAPTSGKSDDSTDSDSSGDSDSPDECQNSGDSDAEVPANRDNAVVEKLNEQAQRLETSLSNHKTASKEPYTVEPGATVFIRNIPIDATQKTVFEAMKRFGFVKSTRLVLNRQTQRPKGTAFVDFRSAEDASKAAKASQSAIDKSGPPVVIAGKPVEIHIALGTDDIRDLAVRKSKGLAGHGKAVEKGRNLYLAQEGLIAEGSTAWNSLSNSDKEKRARAATESEMKLKSPNFAVSTTRLNVRNVPKSWDERKLKDLFIKAVKARATKENPKVVQVKILTNPSGASKGIAFVEFHQHDHALCALRELNNNPETWSKDHRPIIEFAIDNVQALKKRSMNQLKQMDSKKNESKASQSGKTDDDAAEGKKAKKKKKAKEAADTATKSKRKLRMERRQMLKQKNRNAKNKASGEGTATPADNAAPTKVGKSARRREQRRKRDQDVAVDGLAKTGASGGEIKAKKKRKTDNSLEAQVEARLSKMAKPPVVKKNAEARWFD